ncbi:ferric reductase-like transmembrane domain-containing protein [Amycolatopsis nigrescens]|uniref:ferric reductase-like transmembrane domain-containing protein n=1 Tax=Amycolatopsis nigrescens TaxID=381445 RepID=UPI00037EACF9|nr:ferric reductase-like transmembrane domain-containing protein [Amycolatopsis nigrescens]
MTAVPADGWSRALVVLAQSADLGVRDIAALSARVAYAFMCLTLCWGVLTTTGWARRLGERKTLRGGHLALAAFTLSFAVVHALCFLFLSTDPFDVAKLVIPLLPGTLARHTAGIVGLELMLAVALTAGLHRWTAYRRWLWLHRLAYPAVGLGVLHSLFGALANGHLSLVWLAGITLLVPAATLGVLRFLPTRTLERIGLVEERV